MRRLSQVSTSATGAIPLNLDRILVHACGAAFFARLLCDTYGVDTSDRDVVLTVCLVKDILTNGGELPVEPFLGQSAVLKMLAISKRVSSCGMRARKLKELFRDGSRLEIIVGLSVLMTSKRSGIPPRSNC
jgi:hypothetical protein